MPGAQTTLRIVSSPDWYKGNSPALAGVPSARSTAEGSETARWAIALIAIPGESACKALLHSAMNPCVLNTLDSFTGSLQTRWPGNAADASSAHLGQGLCGLREIAHHDLADPAPDRGAVAVCAAEVD